MEQFTATHSPALKLKKRLAAGYSLIEVNVATAMIGTFISAILVLNSNLLGILRSAKETVSASQAIQERGEQMRISNWVQITDTVHIKNKILNTATSSASSVPEMVETMTVSAYPANGSPVSQVTRNSNGTVTVNSSNSALVNERMVRVDLKVVWKTTDKRERTRVNTALIAKGGVSK